MDRDLEWDEYLKKVRQEIENIERKKLNTAREKEVLKYLVTHPKNGAIDDLMSVNGIEVIGKAVLKLKMDMSNNCSNCNKIELCDILECLYCNNSSYVITLENGNGIKKNAIDIDSNYHEYEILFYDIIPTEMELFSYLFDDESRYKIIRKVDNTEVFDTTYKIRLSNKIKQLTKK